MDLNKLTEKSQDALRAAQSLAVQRSHSQLEVEHLLLSLLNQEAGLTPNLLKKAGIALDPFRSRAEQE
ncbi:MAG: Clp protease N-terminal domain-containing protein, partial [Acidobacteriota bacterium]